MTTGIDVVRAHYDNLSRADWERWREMLTPDFSIHHASTGDLAGRDAYLDSVRRYRESFPDATVELHRLLQADELVAAEFTSRGTFLGELLGVRPTGRAWALRGMGFYRVEGDRLAEAWFVEDFTGWLRELGLPGTGSAGTGSAGTGSSGGAGG